MCEWFESAGLTVNPSKSEIMGFGFTPAPVVIAGKIVEPKSKIKFLGLTIRSDLRWSDHVDGICAAVRKAAGRIRFEGRHLGRDERRTLYHAWVGGRIHYNAGVYLPLLNGNEIGRIQTACNSAVRAVLGLPKKGKVDLDSGFQQLNN